MPESDADALLTRLTKLDAEGRRDALLPYVEKHIGSWGPAIFQTVAVAGWEAGEETESLAVEERRRGLPGLGPSPDGVAAAIKEGHRNPADALDDSDGAKPLHAAGNFELTLSNRTLPPREPDLSRLEDRQITQRAEEAMQRWESLQRVEDAVFTTLVRQATLDIGSTNVDTHLAGVVTTLLSDNSADRSSVERHLITLIALGYRLLHRGGVASERLEKALDLCRREGLSGSLKVSAAVVVGKLLPRAGRGGEAKRLLSAAADEALAARGPLNEPVRGPVQPSGRAISVVLAHLGILSDSPNRKRELYESALKVARDARDRRKVGALLRLLGILQHDAGFPDRAQTLYEIARKHAREAGDRALEGDLQGNIANLQRETGSPTRARELYRSALEAARESGDRKFEAIVCSNLGALYAAMGSPVRAREIYESALEIVRDVGDRGAEAHVLSNLAILQDDTGSSDRALELLECALEAAREVGERAGEGIVLENLANIHARIGSRDHARKLYDSALDIARSLRSRSGEAHVLGNLGELHKCNGDYTRALGCYEVALDITREAGERDTVAWILSSLAAAKLDLGRSESALADANASCRILSELGDSRMLCIAQHTLARSLLQVGNYAEARATFRAAIQSLELWLHGIGPDFGRANVLEAALPLFQDTISFLLRDGRDAPEDVAEAFEAAERGKARSLLEHVRSRHLSRSIPVPLAEKRDHVEIRLRSLQDALLRERSNQNPRQQMVTFLGNELSDVRKTHRNLLDDIAARFPIYAAEEGLTAPLPLAEVQARLATQSDAALIEYLVTSEETFVWVVRHDQVDVVRLGIGEMALFERVTEVLHTFTEAAEEMLGVFPQDLRALAEVVVGPVLPYVDGIRRLLIVPSGALHDIPFEMLVMRMPGEDGWPRQSGIGRFASPEYFVDRFEIAYGPSATLLDPDLDVGDGKRNANTPMRWAESRVFALADPIYDTTMTEPVLSRACIGGLRLGPLPGTRREVRAIRRLFPRARCFTRSGARESTYRKHAPTAQLVHLGCHGLVDRDDPAFSGVVLSPGRRQDEDALLQSYEIAEVRLKHRPLIVLSACGVAGGKRSPSEGLLGLTRSFVQAGAGVVVASTWPADDTSTAQLMSAFYRALAQDNLDSTAALAAAKRRMLERARRSPTSSGGIPAAHPYHWAGFRAYGIDRLRLEVP